MAYLGPPDKYDGDVKYAGEMAGSNIAKRVPELPDQLERLTRAVSGAEEVFGQLFQRFDPVLRSSPPQPTGASQGVSSAAPSTLYAEQVWRVGERLERLIGHAVEIQSRLEI